MKSIILFFKRLFGIANASTQQMMNKMDKNIDLASHAQVLLQQQKDSKVKVIHLRNTAISEKKALEQKLFKAKTSYEAIELIIVEDFSYPEAKKDATYRQNILNSVHQGPLLLETIESLEKGIQLKSDTINILINNIGTLERNTMTLEHKLDMLKTRDATAQAKIEIFTPIAAEQYFNLEKLTEIVDSKEVQAETAEEIYNMDQPITATREEVDAEAFKQKVLMKHKKISKPDAKKDK